MPALSAGSGRCRLGSVGGVMKAEQKVYALVADLVEHLPDCDDPAEAVEDTTDAILAVFGQSRAPGHYRNKS